MYLSLTSPLFEPWLQFKRAAVRQLAFAIASPNILIALPSELQLQHDFSLHSNSMWQQHFKSYLPRLKHLDQNPTELHIFLAQLKSTRLGLRFEMLIWFWLLDHRYHAYQLLGHSIQMIDGSRTIGELDFLVKNTQTQQVEHWEVALKYYLGEADLSLNTWYGLNRSDTLARKLQHFTHKQFQFSDVLDTPIERRFAVLKGQLFLPLSISSKNPSRPPDWINLQRRLGIWGQSIPKPEFNSYRLQRQEWICPEAQPTSPVAKWWTHGLYLQKQNNQFYMYRNPSLLLN